MSHSDSSDQLDSDSDGALGDERLGGAREIYSSSSKRSFGSQPQQPAEEAKSKPKRAPSAGDPHSVPNETDVVEKSPEVSKKSVSSESTPPVPGDAPPPVLDKSVDEGPL